MVAEVVQLPGQLETSAKRIKQLMQNWTENTLALGKELADARAAHFQENQKRPGQWPGFNKWAQEVTGLTMSSIQKLLKIYEKFGSRRAAHQISQQVLHILSSNNVPEEARKEAIERSESGEHITRKQAKEIADKHRLPSPKEANKQAKEEGKPVLANDGYIYFGTDPSKAKEGMDRRRMVYGVKEALEHLASITLTGRQFLNYAFPHQLWSKEEAPTIKKALHWLQDLDEAWDARQ